MGEEARFASGSSASALAAGTIQMSGRSLPQFRCPARNLLPVSFPTPAPDPGKFTGPGKRAGMEHPSDPFCLKSWKNPLARRGGLIERRHPEDHHRKERQP